VSLAQFGGRRQDAFNLDFSLTPEETTPPVPILRYIDTQNPDGSYTYGYESGDGTYKIETRFATGEVKGKYGYIDSNGKLREVEYGATPGRGFEPRAEGLVLPPPTVAEDIEEPVAPAPLPAPVAAEPEAPAAEASSGLRFKNFSAKSGGNRRVKVVRKSRPANRRLPIRGKPVAAAAPARLPPRRVAPAAPRPVAPAAPVFVAPSAESHPSLFGGHPAQNIDLNTGSFSVVYSG